MASGSRWLLGAVVVVGFAGGGYWLANGGGDNPAVPAPSGTAPSTTKTEPAPAAPVVSPLQTPESAGVPKDDCIAYPDGTYLPPLNGVKKAPTVSFHRWMPFTKVVRKERDPRTGLEWYVHENGARSTTRLMWKDGVQVASGDVEMPAPSRPLIDEK